MTYSLNTQHSHKNIEYNLCAHAVKDNTLCIIPAKEDHLHVSAGQDLPDPCHFGQVPSHLRHLLLCSDRIQFLIAVGFCQENRPVQIHLMVQVLHQQH